MESCFPCYLVKATRLPRLWGLFLIISLGSLIGYQDISPRFSLVVGSMSGDRKGIYMAF
ncbi:hypothetical protein BT63DRAFT_419472 [Microthyrium microscopicum]|uniref:Uncharacterized protein n=1 Tax=Microthyrium microscopicum TaxID=703497 RepID=A0A6A6UPE8_9PEZI|nr:hypothetical protein BT63DRAFT_419472 [Microthyrium microscopicum]